MRRPSFQPALPASFAFALTLSLITVSPLVAEELGYSIENFTAATGTKQVLYFQPRAAIVPGEPLRVLMLMQEMHRGITHDYRDVFEIETGDLGKTWSPAKCIEAIRPVMQSDGYRVAPGDLVPKWHAKTGTVLATGKTFNFLKGKKEDKSRERVAYTTYNPDSGNWSTLGIMELPQRDHRGRPIVGGNSGCSQRYDLPNGDILLPVQYYYERSRAPRHTAVVALCEYDGKTLRYKKHGSELSVPRARGLCEPSLTRFGDRYFLTLRSDHSAYVTSGTDGINYDAVKPWKFDDGEVLGSYNTQQHWVTHRDGLFLVYTRRGADNDHIMRHRAPLFIARVDPDRLCVLRKTERVLIPENDATLGNSGVTEVSPHETWVTVGEGLFSSKRRGKDRNKVIVARIVWSKANGDPAE